MFWGQERGGRGKGGRADRDASSSPHILTDRRGLSPLDSSFSFFSSVRSQDQQPWYWLVLDPAVFPHPSLTPFLLQQRHHRRVFLGGDPGSHYHTLRCTRSHALPPAADSRDVPPSSSSFPCAFPSLRTWPRLPCPCVCGCRFLGCGKRFPTPVLTLSQPSFPLLLQSTATAHTRQDSHQLFRRLSLPENDL